MGFYRALCLVVFFSASLHAQPSETFQKFHSWFKPANFRYRTFEKAFSLMEERNAKVIVETGTTRRSSLESVFSGDGGATLLFCEWAKWHDAYVFSVDISLEAFDAANPLFQSYADCFFPVCSDSIAFLQNFQETIDLLYLDSFDFDQNNPFPSQLHHLKEIMAAYPKLAPHSVVLIDDCGLSHGGKGRLVIAYLQKRGWKILMNEYQVLLTRF